MPTIPPSRCGDPGSQRPIASWSPRLFTFPFGDIAGRAELAIATPVIDAPSWSTSSFSNRADTSPMELSELGEHLDHCKGVHGRLFTFQCLAETMNGFVSSRLVTTLVVATLLIGIGSLVL